jgi:hypothetical protein
MGKWVKTERETADLTPLQGVLTNRNYYGEYYIIYINIDISIVILPATYKSIEAEGALTGFQPLTTPLLQLSYTLYCVAKPHLGENPIISRTSLLQTLLHFTTNACS